MTARQLAILTRTSPLAPSPLAQSKLRPPSTPMSQFSERQRLVLCHPPGYAHKICGRYRAKSRRRSALVVSADVPSLPPGAWTTVGLKLVLFLPRPQSWRLCCKLLLFSSHWSEGHARTRGQISEETLQFQFQFVYSQPIRIEAVCMIRCFFSLWQEKIQSVSSRFDPVFGMAL